MNENHDKIRSTKHREYSLILATIAILFLPFVGPYIHTIPALVFINLFAIVSILWSAFSVVRHADVLAHRLGEPYGSLVLSLSVVILEVSLISILMLSGSAGETLMRDTMQAIIMIVLGGLIGVSLLLGGRKFADQSFNLGSVRQYLIALIPLVFVTMILPSSFPDGTFTNGQLILVALVCIGMYGVFLLLQMRTHQRLFIYEDEDEGSDQNEKPCGQPSPFSSKWHGFWLIVHLVAVIAVTKLNSEFLDELLRQMSAPAQVTGFLIALLTLSPEGLGAIKAVLNNQVQRAINLYFGSVLATISLTVPTVILIALISGESLIFGIDVSGSIILVGVLMLSLASFSSGMTNALNGMSHIAMFIGYLLMLLMP